MTRKWYGDDAAAPGGTTFYTRTMGAAMLQWRGGGRTVAHDPAALREIGYIHEERSAIHEHDGGLDRDDAERIAWEHVAREWSGIVGGAYDPSKGVTRHWRPPQPDRDTLAK
ncbi:hypothetical protein ACFL09_05355 [Planctomycetota bacterium]